MASDLQQAISQGQPEYVHLNFTDILGFAKSLAIPISRLQEAIQEGVAFDGSAIKGFVRVQESDMLLFPDPQTWQVLPAPEGKYPRLLSWVHHPDRTPFSGCPRNCLALAEKKLLAQGFTVQVGAEMEYFLFKPNSRPPVPCDKGYYFDLENDAGANLRRELTGVLREARIGVRASHHENSPGQQEICLEHHPPLKLADNIMTFRWLTKLVAAKQGLKASFMPKPLYGVNGSGMHLHFSLHGSEGNATQAQTMSFLAGILEYGPELSAITNPLVNSYKRLVPGFEAPIAALWSQANRSPMIRIPHHPQGKIRFEVRSPDPACNPYLGLAVLLRAGLRGLEEELIPPPPVQTNISKLGYQELKGLGQRALPTSLGQALRMLEESQLAKETLGEHIFSNYLQAKGIEWEIYRRQIHEWEYEQYLDKY